MTGDSSKPISFLRHHIASAHRRFQKLSIRGKVSSRSLYSFCDERSPSQLLIFAIVLFYCVLVALIIIVTPARIAQTIYDWGQRIREHPLGWLLLAALIRMYALYVSHPLSLFVYQRSCPSHL